MIRASNPLYSSRSLKGRVNEQAREDYIKEVNPILQEMGLRFPIRSQDDGTFKGKRKPHATSGAKN